ncbi:NUDIX hydrolase [Patescibacteria group bacterium]|nr:NUDIX hydrolase [Patescibacteria group bacterium]
MKNIEDSFEKFTISQCGLFIDDNKCLLGEFKSHPGFWGLPGGRIDKGEEGGQAFKRELQEEIGLKEFKIIALVDFCIWYNPKNVARCAIVYLIKAGIEKVKAGDEFLKIHWVEEKDLKKYNFVWPHATKAIKKGFEIHRKIKIL